MSAEEFERAADQLCDVLIAIDDVDLNVLLDDDVRALLDCKDTVGELCSQYRRDQHTSERLQEGESP